MQLTIFAPGDPSVGIPSTHFTLDLGDIDQDVISHKEYREGIREAAVELGNAITGDNCKCRFSDEMEQDNAREEETATNPEDDKASRRRSRVRKGTDS